MMWEMIFWTAVLAVVYLYLGYPLVLLVLNRLSKKRPLARRAFAPSVSLIISAYNEQEVIRRKIENSLSLDYPEPGKVEVIVASDGSTDETCKIAREFEAQGVVLHHHADRQGKNRVLNDVTRRAKGEILVFTDANGMFEKDALCRLIEPFADPRVGCVCGELIYRNPNRNPVAEGYNHYWRYDQWLKRLESGLQSLLGANGSIFAVRKELNEPLDPRASNDMVLPIKIAARGFAVVYEPEAISVEAGSSGAKEELRRRSRIVARGLMGTLLVTPELIRKKKVLLVVQLFSRKFLRYLFPVLLAAALLSNCFLSGPFYRLTLAAQMLPYLLMPLGYFLVRKGKSPRLLSVPYYFCVGLLAAVIGLMKVVFFRELATWEGFDRRDDLILSDGKRSAR